MWNGVSSIFRVLLFLVVARFSFFINCIYCFVLWYQNFLPEFGLMSVALICSLLTLFKGCTSSLLIFGRTP